MERAQQQQVSGAHQPCHASMLPLPPPAPLTLPVLPPLPAPLPPLLPLSLDG